MEKSPKVMTLFKYRHSMPKEASESVFKAVRDPTDLNLLMDQAHNALQDCSELKLYVTGLSTALVTVINYCIFNSIPLTLMHHDRKTNTYFPQTVRVHTNIKEKEEKEKNNE